ncbi:MAG: DUF5009 domain-containing protein [Planctomycetes bacterium]|nr:DUF5009 domain-containing protein [Planctomycetota bacterium]
MGTTSKDLEGTGRDRGRPAPRPRWMSLDALRGFDMFWIMGGDALARALAAFGDGPLTGGLARQLTHAEWEGFHFYDLVFPLFVFVMGASIVFSMERLLEERGLWGALLRVFARFALLFAVGIFYSGGFTNAWPEIRLLGVLNRLALCYLGAALLYCLLRERPRLLAALAAALLVGYWALMSFVPYPDLRPVDGAGRRVSETMTAENVAQLNWGTTTTLRGIVGPGLNLANYLDARFLPGKLWEKTWDPEGLLSTLPALASALLGVQAGGLLLQSRVGERRKVGLLALAGSISVVLGFAWGIEFPVVKKLWTSSYVLVSAGFSALLLALFHHVIEVRGKRAWCAAFVWYGMNPITVYLADNLVGFRRVAARFLGGDVKAFFDARVGAGCGDLVLSLGEVAVGLCLVWFLHRRRIFLRL